MRHAPSARMTTCSYGLSRLQFRGPRRPTDGGYVACPGGSETFGRDVAQPFPDLLEQETGMVCLNLGQHLAGPDLFLRDAALRALVHDAAAVVIQVMGAANLSNRFYKVHPRRNDRFIAPRAPLRRLYPEVDFTEIAFTGHLMAKLAETDGTRLTEVQQELRGCWVRRMRELVGLANVPVHLLWFAPRHPEDPAGAAMDPCLVTPGMLDAVGTRLTKVVYDSNTGQRPNAPGIEDHRRAAAALGLAMGA
ncbi:DUF6473 family protein [Salibaculum halophilum]|uniref:DUF6473 family protein n=1 Tax=Salibaculum halophilum TaxID=1914408 RepID=UPI0024819EE0|nr:DUF6473 family protein [Salibaculum halophilum]